MKRGSNRREARSEIDIRPDRVEQVVDPSERRTSVERLEVYANAYYARLLECLRDEFPALLHAVGEEVFDGLAFGYLQAYPSTELHACQSEPAIRPIPRGDAATRRRGGGASPSWPDFMIDLARLERCYSDVFDGPGAERLKLLEAAAFKDHSARGLDGQARLVPVPCLRLFVVALSGPGVRDGRPRKKRIPTLPDPEPTWLAVSRVDYVVRRWTLSPVQYRVAAALIDGQTVGSAIERAAMLAVESGESLERLAGNLRDWFAEWSSAGFFQAIEVPGSSER